MNYILFSKAFKRLFIKSFQTMMKLRQQEMCLGTLRTLVMATRISPDMACMFQHFVSR